MERSSFHRCECKARAARAIITWCRARLTCITITRTAHAVQDAARRRDQRLLLESSRNLSEGEPCNFTIFQTAPNRWIVHRDIEEAQLAPFCPSLFGLHEMLGVARPCQRMFVYPGTGIRSTRVRRSRVRERHEVSFEGLATVR